MPSLRRDFWLQDWNRVLAAVLCGTATALLSGAWFSGPGVDVSTPWLTAGLIGWIVFIAVHALWVTLSVRGMDAEQTRLHARREDPSRSVRDILHVVSAAAAVAGMGAMLIAADSAPVARVLNAALGLAAVLGAWTIIQIVYMLRYAALYYEDADSAASAAIDFNNDQDPTYLEFAYFAFTIGASFATSDAAVRATSIRLAVLRHSLLSFFFGSVVLASATSLMLQLVSLE
ncbi:MAG: DUF1345 domain-containing protein [Micrococcaceae bacterium]